MYIHMQIIKLNTYLQITNYLPSLLSQTQCVFCCLSFILTDLLESVLRMVGFIMVQLAKSSKRIRKHIKHTKAP